MSTLFYKIAAGVTDSYKIGQFPFRKRPRES